MNEYKYLYTVFDDYYGFSGTDDEEISTGVVVFHGDMYITDLRDNHKIGMIRYNADKIRLYKIKEVK